MKLKRFTVFFFTLLAIATGAHPSPVLAKKHIPQPPTFYVLDEPQVLSKPILESIQKLLIEHDHLAGEQIVIAIFSSLEGEDPVLWTTEVFKAWEIGQRGKDNGVLLTIFWKDHRSRLEVGYGLESILTDAKSKEILTHFLSPELRNQNPDRALSITTLEILRALESPLIENHKAQEILRLGGLSGPLHSSSSKPQSWPLWLILGFLLLVFVLNLLTTAEAHFNRDGWFRPGPWPKPWPRRRPTSDWNNLSPKNSSTDVDRFYGGGGQSGGGGATGDW